MKKQKKLVVGNWKMNPLTVGEAKEIAGSVKKVMNSVRKTEVVLCPPFVYLGTLSKFKKGSLFLGAQNVHNEVSGSFTGEVSFSQVSEFGVDYVIIGHSERRKMGETDEIVNKKVKAVINSKMNAIVCIGESVRDHGGEYFDFIKNQIILALKDVSKKAIENVVIAYEPIWAIGAKEAMSSRDLHEMSIFIRKVLKDLYGPFADDVRILYGGSVDKGNAESLVKEGNVSGLLVGRESLKTKNFIELIKAVDSI